MNSADGASPRFAHRLYALLFGDWRPKRVSRMTGRSGQAHKFVDIADYRFTPAHLADHLDGRETYATTLGLLGDARAGVKDYDSASDAEILGALRSAAERGITAAAFLMTNDAGGHAGGHLWTLYDAPYAEADIRAQLRTIPRSGKGEDYPSGNPIRLPFGYHKVKRTRGTLVLQDGRRFDLDTPAGLAAGIEAFLSLPRNGKPEPCPIGDARSDGGQAWGDAYDPAHWNDLPDGGRLWRSPYIAAAAQRRPDLAKLLRGERVTLINKDDTRDDSDSAQVAALAYNLLSADVCNEQARAIADYLKPQLRPGRTRDHYRAHFDAELERYTPEHYQPRVILILGPAGDGDRVPLPAAEHRPQPKSRARKDRPQKVAGAPGYLEWLRSQVDAQSGSVMLSQNHCAARLGCHVRTIKRYEKALAGQIERRVYARRQAGCLFILAPDVVTTSAADVVIAEPAGAQPDAENSTAVSVEGRNTPPPPVPAPALSVRALVAEAFDVLAVGGARLSFSRVRRYVEANAGRSIAAPVIVRTYAAERDRRQYLRSLERQIAALPAMPIGKLTRLDKRIQRAIADGPRAPGYHWAADLLPALSAEQERRGEIRDRLRTDRRRRTIDQALLFAEVEDQIAAHRAASQKKRNGPIARAARPGGAECSDPPAPAGAAQAAIDPPGIVGRLKAARDRRQAAAGQEVCVGGP